MKYIIKIWETEERRDSGESDIIETNIKSLKEAIDKSKKIMEEQNYASLNVQNTNENCSFYYCTPNSEEYIYNDILHNLEDKDIVKAIVELYFAENNINNLMDYGADRDSLVMPSLSELYKEILDKLHIEYTSIETDDISDGKYKTDIEFKDDSIIRVDTSAFNDTDIVISNVESIKQEYEKIKEKEIKMQNERIETLDDMEM